MAQFQAGRPQPDEADLRPPAHVYLQPISPPVTLGLWGFFASTMVVSTWLLGWWGNDASAQYFFEIAAVFGGLAQFLDGLWSFRARDYIASALLTMWGTYWMSYGFMVALGTAGVLTIPKLDEPFPAFGVWFIPLGLFTCWGAIAALRENLPLFFLLGTVGSGCGAVAAGFWVGSPHWVGIGAWLFIFGAGWAWYVGSMAMLESAWGRVILPIGVVPGLIKHPVAANVPGRTISQPAAYALGQPGVRHGQ
jgi:succinate-acetate transporter protein